MCMWTVTEKWTHWKQSCSLKPKVWMLNPSSTFWSLFSGLSGSGGRGQSQGGLEGFMCEGLLSSESEGKEHQNHLSLVISTV